MTLNYLNNKQKHEFEILVESVILSHYYLFLCCIVLFRCLLNCLPIHVYLLFMELDPSSLSQHARLSPNWLNPSFPDATPSTLSLSPAHQPESIHPVFLNAFVPLLSLFFFSPWNAIFPSYLSKSFLFPMTTSLAIISAKCSPFSGWNYLFSLCYMQNSWILFGDTKLLRD